MMCRLNAIFGTGATTYDDLRFRITKIGEATHMGGKVLPRPAKPLLGEIQHNRRRLSMATDNRDDKWMLLVEQETPLK